MDVNNPAGYNKTASMYSDRRRYDDAIKEYEAAIKVDSQFTEAWFRMGEVYEVKGDRDNARKAYQGAIDNKRRRPVGPAGPGAPHPDQIR